LNLFGLLLFASVCPAQVLDPSFANGGKFTAHLGDENYSVIRDAKFLPDGKILVCGEKQVGFLYKSVVARYLPDGSPDQEFGTNGMTIFNIGSGNGGAASLLLLPGGKFLVGGENTIDYWGGEDLIDSILIRCNENGSLDSAFGVNGMVTTDASGASLADAVYSLAIDGDGKILATGYSAHNGANSNVGYYEDFMAMRYNSDGTLDETFASGGIFRQNIGQNSGAQSGSVDYAYRSICQPDGKVLICGISDATSPIEDYNMAIMRLNHDGTPDSAFGQQGIVIWDTGDSETFASIHLLADGNMLVVGSSVTSGSGHAKIVKLQSNGSPDVSFGVSGVAESDFDSQGSQGILVNSFLMPDGKILATGFKVGDLDLDDVAMRFNPDGTLDETFGAGGRVALDFMAGSDKAVALDVDADGNFIIAGGSANGSSEYFDWSMAKFLNQPLRLPQTEKMLFKAWPNPFADKINIDAAAFLTSARLTDAAGRTIGKWKLYGDSPTLSVESVPSGIYFLTVTGDGQQQTVKLVK
jgi:uncharacterized delta-60 repeat protein